MDAVFLSPHKFVGGPQTPGILVVRRELVGNAVPTTVGGGTVAFVDPLGHRYLDDPVAREEGGTPAIIESIHAGLVFAVKDAVGTDSIRQREEQLWQHAFGRWQSNPNIEVLGHPQARRLSIVSFRIRVAGRHLHHNYVVALLNDLFGIQARGGCSCAGPYGHRLLAIDPEHSHAYRHEVGIGCEGVKPGWTRINFHYLISDAVRDYLTDAVDLLARYGHRLLTDYRFDPHTGLWRHRDPLREPPVRLADVHYTAAGITSPGRHTTLGGERARRPPPRRPDAAGHPARRDPRRGNRAVRRVRGVALVPPTAAVSRSPDVRAPLTAIGEHRRPR